MNPRFYFPPVAKNLLKKSPLLMDLLYQAESGILDAWHGREISTYTEVPTMLTLDQRYLLFEAAKSLPTGSNIVEIGCYAGGSAIFLGMGAMGSGSHVYSVDPFEWNNEKGCLRHKPSFEDVSATMRRYQLDDWVTLIQAYSTQIAESWDRGPIALLWIDGDHTQAKADFDAWKPHLKRGAVVAFDDSNFPKYGVEKATEDVEAIVSSESVWNIQRIHGTTAFKLGD